MRKRNVFRGKADPNDRCQLPSALRHSGFTLLELLVVTVVLTVLVAILIPVTTCGCRGRSSGLKDGTQIQQIHKGMLIWAADNKGSLPIPSEVAVFGGAFLTQPNRMLNTSARLSSAMIGQNFFTPEICVSPVEVSALVSVDDDYDYSQYRPAQGEFWDDRFTADPSRGSNTSYAHLALCGARLGTHWQNSTNWRNSATSNAPLLGNRATGGGPFVLGGATSGPDHDRSITLEFHDTGNQWSGNIVFADNHREMVTGLTHPSVTYTPAGATVPLLDNFFTAEFMDAWVNGRAQPEASNDVWMGLFVSASADGRSCSPRFDPLKP